ncbi:SymE family type I addiction module toxin [Hymenobacter antarcticus]|uniref:Toxin SymE-like domain-containing protein n=1 Tax=Hymenobacter antarcticus TaxID=486270 RepID=A0ABP7QRP6_9BACT
MQARRIKVAPHYRQLHPQVRITSQLRLQGNWLAAAGFAPGTVAAIEVQAGRLIITPAPVQ